MQVKQLEIAALSKLHLGSRRKQKNVGDILSKTRAGLYQAEQKMAARINHKIKCWSKPKKAFVLVIFLLFLSAGYALVLYQTINRENKPQMIRNDGSKYGPFERP